MATAHIIKQLCEHMNISLAEFAILNGQTRQKFNKKFETLTFK